MVSNYANIHDFLFENILIFYSQFICLFIIITGAFFISVNQVLNFVFSRGEVLLEEGRGGEANPKNSFKR